MSTDTQDLEIIGSTVLAEIAGIKNIPAKIDTGADSSSVWVSNINMEKDGTLHFSLFSEKSPLYTGEILSSSDYAVKTVRSSHGDEQIRYRVKLPIRLGEQTFETTFTLANRSRNNFPVLIGRRTLDGRFLVDVSQSVVKRKHNPNTPGLNRELKDDPYKFHQKYLNSRKENL